MSPVSFRHVYIISRKPQIHPVIIFYERTGVACKSHQNPLRLKLDELDDY